MAWVDTASGLTSIEASQRLLRDGPNELPVERPHSLVHQVWDVVREPMLLLLLAASAINFLLAEALDAAILASFVLFVVAISLYQRRKTENALGALGDRPLSVIPPEVRRSRGTLDEGFTWVYLL